MNKLPFINEVLNPFKSDVLLKKLIVLVLMELGNSLQSI
jgi:hypothetical protein